MARQEGSAYPSLKDLEKAYRAGLVGADAFAAARRETNGMRLTDLGSYLRACDALTSPRPNALGNYADEMRAEGRV